MTIASFEDLCGGICDLAGSPVPDLTRDDDGRLAVALPMDGVEITLTHEPARSVTHFFVLRRSMRCRRAMSSLPAAH